MSREVKDTRVSFPGRCIKCYELGYGSNDETVIKFKEYGRIHDTEGHLIPRTNVIATIRENLTLFCGVAKKLKVIHSH